MFGCGVQTCSLILLQTEEGQRVDGGGRGGRRFSGRVETSAESVARIQPRRNVDAGDQRVQVEVAERRHQGVGDGVGAPSTPGIAVYTFSIPSPKLKAS